jgi:hypothetical protein
MAKKVYKRLALCEISEDEHGSTIGIKIEVPPAQDFKAMLINDGNLEQRLYAQLALLREKEDFTKYHVFLEQLIFEYTEIARLSR